MRRSIEPPVRVIIYSRSNVVEMRFFRLLSKNYRITDNRDPKAESDKKDFQKIRICNGHQALGNGMRSFFASRFVNCSDVAQHL